MDNLEIDGEACGRCGACLRRKFKSCPTRQSNWSVTCDVWPHFQGGYGQYFYLGANHAIFKLPDAISDSMAGSLVSSRPVGTSGNSG